MEPTTYAESISCPNKKLELNKIKKEIRIFFKVMDVKALKLRKYSQAQVKKLENFQI